MVDGHARPGTLPSLALLQLPLQSIDLSSLALIPAAGAPYHAVGQGVDTLCPSSMVNLHARNHGAGRCFRANNAERAYPNLRSLTQEGGDVLQLLRQADSG